MELVKKSIKNLKTYNTYNMPFNIKLDANEGKNIIFNDGFDFKEGFQFNFYPDSDSTQLRKEIGGYIGVKDSKIIVGNGSSEMIDIIMKTFIDKDEIVLSFTPTFSMYRVYSQIYSANYIEVESEENLSLDINKLIKKSQEVKPKIILICNPNNPTGYQLPISDIRKLLNKTKALVVVDEAYMEFSKGSIISELDNYPNLVILRTFSKAFGLAGIRLGYIVANENQVEVINRVRAPYNLNVITQYIGIKALERRDKIKEYVKEVKIQRNRIYQVLKSMDIKVYESSANFIFFRTSVKNLAKKLADKGILIRYFSGDFNEYYRVSIGSAEENSAFIKCLKEIIDNEES